MIYYTTRLQTLSCANDVNYARLKLYILRTGDIQNIIKGRYKNYPEKLFIMSIKHVTAYNDKKHKSWLFTVPSIHHYSFYGSYI